MASFNREKLLSKEHLKKVFNVFDKDGKGSIDPKVLLGILSYAADTSKTWGAFLSKVRGVSGRVDVEKLVELVEANEW